MEKESLIIQNAAPGDALEILSLQKAAYQSEALIYPEVPLPPMTQTEEEMADDIKKMTVLKAVRGRAVKGSVRAVLEDGTCRIGRLIVSPECQGQGMGSRLMKAIEAAFPEALRFELFTGEKSQKNLTFYQNRGYSPFRTQAVSPDLTLVFLEKKGYF